MSFVSYAQNFEDVMLWRALGTVEKGNYIDVGAQDPVIDSVSLAFYEHGWRGLSVEPTNQYATALRQARPDEDVRQVAVGSQPGQITFYEFADSGLSTGDEAIAQAHIKEGFEPNVHSVDVVTLDDLLSEWQETPVHWLKIDVEGMEGEVIAGWQTSPVRPWVLVIESHAPGSQRHAHEAWEKALVEKGYHYVYTDGINRFYISEQHPELTQAFAYPPNVFDEFALSGQASNAFCNQVKHQVHLTEVRAAKAEEQLFHANAKIHQLDAAHQQLLASHQQLSESHRQLIVSQQTLSQCLQDVSSERLAMHAQYEQLQNQLNEQRAQTELMLISRSWRITAPLRSVTQRLKKGSSAQPSASQRLNRGLKWTAWQVARRPRLKKAALYLLKRNPWLFERITRRLNRAMPPSASGGTAPLVHQQATLTARARKLHQTLSGAKKERHS